MKPSDYFFSALLIFILGAIAYMIFWPSRKPTATWTHPTTPPKLCKACRHYAWVPGLVTGTGKSRCERPCPTDPVPMYIDPALHTDYERSCIVERTGTTPARCGPDAWFFEPKEEPVMETPMEMRA